MGVKVFRQIHAVPVSAFKCVHKVESGGTVVYCGDDIVYAYDMAEMLREEEPSCIDVEVITIFFKDP